MAKHRAEDREPGYPAGSRTERAHAKDGWHVPRHSAEPDNPPAPLPPGVEGYSTGDPGR